MPLDVIGAPGFVRGGVPFPPGRVLPDDSLTIEGATAVDTEVTARWGDGSVRWLLVEAVAGGAVALTRGVPLDGPGVGAGGLTDGLALDVDGVRTDLSSADWRIERETTLSVRLTADGETPGGLVWRARIERAVGTPDRLRLQLHNPRPTTERNGQPQCLRLGCAGTVPVRTVALRSGDRVARVRWAEENGAAAVAGGADLLPEPLELRPGERWGWEIALGEGELEPALLEFPAHWGCATGALGPLEPFDLAAFGDYERNNSAGAEGIRAGRARPHWRNPRDHGEDQRDWDGGDVDTDWQTHNSEYNAHLAYAKQRIRTMGLHESSRDWHYLGVTGTRHFANVDIYHVHEGPLRWMWGAPFQHVKHGGAGHHTMHRSVYAPNLAHQNGRGLLAWYWLTGDPLLDDAFREVAENARWRVANGPESPGYSNTDGEERAPAMALGLLTDAWIATEDAAFFEAARQVVDESHARTKRYIVSPSAEPWRCKPWMIALLAVALEEFIDAAEEYGRAQDAAEARASLRLYQAFLASLAFRDGEFTRLPYQVSSDPEERRNGSVDSWNVVVADAVVSLEPELAKALFRAGTRSIWYPEHPAGEYSTLLSHTVMSGWGHRTMSVLEGGPDRFEVQ